MSLKPIPQPALMEIVVELYLRGFEARALLLCSGLEEEEGKRWMSKQFKCPLCEEGGSQGEVVHSIKYNF